MSFILDALKKLEQEKAARRQGEINIPNEILRANHRTPRRAERAVPWRAVGIVAAGSVVVLALVGGYFRHQKSGVAESKNRAMETDVRPEMPKPAPPPPASGAPQAQAPPQPRAPESVTPYVPQGIPQPVAVSPKKSRNAVPVEPAAAFTPPSAETYQGGSASGSGDLTVSGIAWQDERKARRAVVNGQLIGEGAMIGGARVVEIQQSQVRFSSNGRTFEVTVSGAQQGR